MSAYGAQISQITLNSNYTPLAISQSLLDNFTLKLLCQVITSSLPANPTFLILLLSFFTYPLDDYHWQPNFLKHTKFKQKTSN